MATLRRCPRGAAAILLLAVVLLHTPSAATATLTRTTSSSDTLLRKKFVTNATEYSAVCNDHSPAIYYLHQNNASNKWIIFFESGGVCHDDASCYKRTLTDRILTSSDGFPDSITGEDLLSARPGESPFADFNRVLVPYCSSDLFLGRDTLERARGGASVANTSDASVANTSDDKFDAKDRGDKFDAKDSGTFVFAGRRIVQRVLAELHALGLRRATEVVLGGTSAGGLGALNAVRHVRRCLVPSGARISALIDSSWFIDFYGSTGRLFPEEMVRRTRMADGYAPCGARDGPSRCCLSCSCLVEKILPATGDGNAADTSLHCGLDEDGGGGGGATTPEAAVAGATGNGDVHVMLLVSRYDLFILGRALSAMKRDGLLGGKDAKQASIVTKATEAIDNYGGMMSGTLERARYANVKFSYVQTACAQHVYFAASSLWANKSSLGAKAVRSYDFGAISFNTEVKKGNWKKVIVDNASLQEHVFKWYSMVNGSRNSSQQGYIVSDKCSGILCNKKCTDSIDVNYSTSALRPKVFQRTVEALCVALLLICCLVKVLLYLEVQRLAHLMSKFSQQNETDGKEAAFNCLPECPDFGRVSIACHCLNYIVPIPSSSQQAPLPTEQAGGLESVVEDDVIEDVDGENDVSYEVGSRLAERDDHTFRRNTSIRVSKQQRGRGRRRSSAVMSRGQFMEQQQEVLRSKMQRYFQSAEDATVSSSYRPHDSLAVSTGTQASEMERSATLEYISELSMTTSTTTNTLTSQLSVSFNGSTVQGNGRQVSGNQTTGGQANGGQVTDSQANGCQVTDSQANGCQAGDLAFEEDKKNPLTNSFLGYSFSSKGDRKGKVMRRLSSVKSSVGARRKAKEKVKVILNNVTTYFNAGQLVAVMGPSGSGKTTFMDLITGRKTNENVSGEIIVNGRYLEDLASWYKQNTGYVLQLATPYYDELTVKENLLYSAMMRVPANTKRPDIFERIDLVMREVGLFESADTVVGGAVGGGLSGGQKRRLSVAIQLIRMPNVLFLDEPTSGLDAHSSLELIRMLSVVAKGGRLVVMSIHQPRLEIYHMFDSILFMCAGKVAFYGSPIRAPDFFLEALQDVPHDSIDDDELANPADVIMDLLDSKKNQKQIIDFYESSEEPSQVEVAVLRNIQDAQYDRGQLPSTCDTQQASVWMRLIGLEGRYSRLQWGSLAYLPIIVITFGLGIGVAYRNTTEGFLLAASYNILTGVSFLFITPYYVKLVLGRMLHVFSLEHDDGVCRAVEFVCHTFLNAVAVTILPLTIMSALVYVMIAPKRDDALESFSVWFIITLINLMSNAVSLAIVIAIACAVPRYAIELSHIACGYVTFFEGFLYTLPNMAVFLRWAVYPNPYFWAFSGEMKALLGGVSLTCGHASPIRCFDKEGDAVLSAFGFQDSDPHVSLLILLGMVPVFLMLAIMALLPWDEFFSMFLIKSTSGGGGGKKVCCAAEPAEGYGKKPIEAAAAALAFPDGDVEAGMGKRPRSETPDVFVAAAADAGGGGEALPGDGGDDEVVVEPSHPRLLYGRSFSMPASASSLGAGGDDDDDAAMFVRNRRPSVNTLNADSEPHVVQGGSAFMTGNDLFTAQLRVKTMSRSRQQGVGSAASVSGRPESGSSSVFNASASAAQIQKQLQDAAGASRPTSLTPGSGPGSSAASPENLTSTETPIVPPPPPPSNESSKFFFPGSRKESDDINAKLLADKLAESISSGNVSRERREHLAKLHARRRERLLSANLSLRKSQSNAHSYNHSLATTPGTPGPDGGADGGADGADPTTAALSARHRRSAKPTLSLGLGGTPVWEQGSFSLQTPPGGRQSRGLQSAPVTPYPAAGRAGSSTPPRFSPSGLRHSLYHGLDPGGHTPPALPVENRRRPQSLPMFGGQPGRDCTSLPGTPLRHFQAHPLAAAAADGHGRKLVAGSPMGMAARRSPDLKQRGAEQYGASQGAAPRRQLRVDQRAVEQLRGSGSGSGGSSTSSYPSDSGSASGPTFSSTSSGDVMDSPNAISPLVGGALKPRGKRLGASSLSQERSLSIGPTPAATPDASLVSPLGGDRSLASTPGAARLLPGTPVAVAGGVQFYPAMSPVESDDAQSPNSPASGASPGRPRPARLTRRKSCQPRVESGLDYSGDVLSPIHEASPTPSPQSTLKRTKSADDMLSAAIAAAGTPSPAQGLKSILRKGPKPQDGGKAGVVFTESVLDSLRAAHGSDASAGVAVSPAAVRDLPLEHALPPPSHSTDMAKASGGEGGDGNASFDADPSGRSSRQANWIGTSRYDPIAESTVEFEPRSSPRQESRDAVRPSSQGGRLAASQGAGEDDEESSLETAV